MLRYPPRAASDAERPISQALTLLNADFPWRLLGTTGPNIGPLRPPPPDSQNMNLRPHLLFAPFRLRG